MLLDVLYAIGGLLTMPYWLVRMIRTGRIRTDWAGRFGRTPPLPSPARPRLLLHAVSVGEVNAIRLLVARLEALPEAPEIVISVTTDTGFARASSLFGNRMPVVRYPFDFSWSVGRFLRSARPDAVVLVELEVWPNFTAACARREVPVGVVNGRLSERSARRYGKVAALVRPSFRRLAFAATQNEAYAARFRELGAAADAVIVTGTMKWDSARIEPDDAAASALAEAMGIDLERPLIVAGSTAPGEHELLQESVPSSVQLLCAPRRPEWFDQAAAALPGCARRSRGDRGSETGRFLLDTIGELSHAYALADVVVVGRSFGDLHGSDMMEPVGLGKPTIVGPAVSDFQDTADVLVEAGGLVRTNADGLAEAIDTLLHDSDRRDALVRAARAAITEHAGATDRNVELVMKTLSRAR